MTGINLRWDYFVNTYDTHHRPISSMSGIPFDARENRHVTFVREFANIVSLFQDKVDSLITYHDDINKGVEEMKSCQYQIDKFEEALKKIQKLVSRKLDMKLETNWCGCAESHMYRQICGSNMCTLPFYRSTDLTWNHTPIWTNG